MWIFSSFAFEEVCYADVSASLVGRINNQDLTEQNSYKISIMNVSNYKECARTQVSNSLQVFFNTNST